MPSPEEWERAFKAADRAANMAKARRMMERGSYRPSDLPVIWYYPGDASVTHTKAIRLSAAIPEDTPFEACTTRVPAVMCGCRKFFLALRPDPQ